jgi:hypothetical protein
MGNRMKWERAKLHKKKTLNYQHEFSFRDRADRWLFGCFTRQRAAAKQRGIPFAMTYEQWLGIWRDSGRLQQRGIGAGRYVMGRHHDVGPYASSNVSIIPNEQNVRDGITNWKTRQALTAASSDWITASSSQVPF